MTYLIVIEAEGVDEGVYHYQPYRLAASVDEAKEMMLDCMRQHYKRGCSYSGDRRDLRPADLVPDYFALYREKDGEFGSPEYYDPCSTDLNVVDPTEWLQKTGRI